MAAHRFRAKLYAVGVNRCVDVPPEVTDALGGETHIRVKGRVGDEPYRSNLAPRARGMHRLFVHSSIWRKLSVDVDLLPAVEEAGFEWLDFSAREAHRLAELPLHHRDPFDRMLIVQSQINDLMLVTDDSLIADYDCRIL